MSTAVAADEPVGAGLGDAVLTPVRDTAFDAAGTARSIEVTEIPGSPGQPLGWAGIAVKTRGCLRSVGWPEHLADTVHEVVTGLPPASAGDAEPGLQRDTTTDLGFATPDLAERTAI